ncbi:MAG: PIN domain-containing protein [Micromonosporaceae bacterium]
MRHLVLDSGGITALSGTTASARARRQEYTARGILPATVPAVVLVECLTGSAGRDARTNLFLKGCRVIERTPERLARRAAALRTLAGRGSAVDAYLVALAETLDAAVLTTDPGDLLALAAHTVGVHVEPA